MVADPFDVVCKLRLEGLSEGADHNPVSWVRCQPVEGDGEHGIALAGASRRFDQCRLSVCDPAAHLLDHALLRLAGFREIGLRSLGEFEDIHVAGRIKDPSWQRERCSSAGLDLSHRRAGALLVIGLIGPKLSQY